MERLEVINQRLIDNYGKSEFEDRSFYRVSWAANEREIITGVFEGRTEAGIYVGTELRTQSVRKYPDWDDYWILEYIQPNLNNHELRANFSYEPIWVFRDSSGNPLPFDWEIIEKIIYFHKYGMSKPKKTQKELDHEQEEVKQQESAALLDELQHDEAFPNKMYDSKVVTVPHKEFNPDVYGIDK